MQHHICEDNVADNTDKYITDISSTFTMATDVAWLSGQRLLTKKLYWFISALSKLSKLWMHRKSYCVKQPRLVALILPSKHS